MQTRIFGRTGHASTVAIFGTAAMGKVAQEQADRAIQAIVQAGVNHIDIAPSYGEAELRVASWLKHEREKFFLGCKTTERTKNGAWQEMHRSLERMHIKTFDLYQLHAVNSHADLDKAFAPDGAIHALTQARAEGLTRYLGITAHGLESPSVLMRALREFDFDSVLVPINARMFAHEGYRRDALALLKMCRERNVGVMAIKAAAKQPWGDRPHTHAPWYEPFVQADEIQQNVNFSLSQDVTGLCTVSDVNLLPLFLQACEAFAPMNERVQAELMRQVQEYAIIFP